MPTIYRRAHLLAAIRQAPGTWTTHRAELVLAVSPWGCHRNTARKDLRALAARGLLTPGTDEHGRRTYTLDPGEGADHG